MCGSSFWSSRHESFSLSSGILYVAMVSELWKNGWLTEGRRFEKGGVRKMTSRTRVGDSCPVAVEVAGKALGFPERAGSRADLTSGPITSLHLVRGVATLTSIMQWHSWCRTSGLYKACMWTKGVCVTLTTTGSLAPSSDNRHLTRRTVGWLLRTFDLNRLVRADGVPEGDLCRCPLWG